MTNLTLYQLQPQALGFHFGEEGLELERKSHLLSQRLPLCCLVATVAEQEGSTTIKILLPPFANGDAFPPDFPVPICGAALHYCHCPCYR
ncbi:MAG: hypothetical protein R3E31_07730 [Chloroflexota bacterium]